MADHYVSPKDFMELGFEASEINEDGQIAYFRAIYGTSPSILALIWDDMNSNNDTGNKLDRHAKPIHLLLYYRWKRSYETELELRTQFNIGEETLRKWIRVPSYASNFVGHDFEFCFQPSSLQ